MIQYHTPSAKDLSRLHQFGKKVLLGNIPRICLVCGENLERRHFGPDIEELERMDTSEIHARRLNAKEVITRTSTLIRDNSERGEEQGNLRGESDGSPPQDSAPDGGEARHDFWSMSGSFIYRHHVKPRVKLYVPREESFPISPRYIDVARATSTTLDVMLECRTDDKW